MGYLYTISTGEFTGFLPPPTVLQIHLRPGYVVNHDVAPKRTFPWRLFPHHLGNPRNQSQLRSLGCDVHRISQDSHVTRWRPNLGYVLRWDDFSQIPRRCWDLWGNFNNIYCLCICYDLYYISYIVYIYMYIRGFGWISWGIYLDSVQGTKTVYHCMLT